MTNREIKIINYFIILQFVKFNRTKAHSIFIKYNDIMDKPFESILLFISRDIPDVLKPINNIIINNAISVFNGENGKLLFFEDIDYPKQLKEIIDFPIVIFYNGNLDLFNEKSISVVGTRRPSDVGINNSQRIAKFLANNNITIVSGLAEGVDSITQDYALKLGYNKLISVIGTPISKYYPQKNRMLQDYIATNCLLISEYAFFENTLKWNFLRRNFIMSAISQATIVIEAGDTSGTINQARNTLKNGRPLFVPSNVFNNPENSWPSKFRQEYNNIFKFASYEEIKSLLIKNGFGI